MPPDVGLVSQTGQPNLLKTFVPCCLDTNVFSVRNSDFLSPKTSYLLHFFIRGRRTSGPSEERKRIKLSDHSCYVRGFWVDEISDGAR